jgi:hypothetical protein
MFSFSEASRTATVFRPLAEFGTTKLQVSDPAAVVRLAPRHVTVGTKSHSTV